jgi:hypothetical protein
LALTLVWIAAASLRSAFSPGTSFVACGDARPFFSSFAGAADLAPMMSAHKACSPIETRECVKSDMREEQALVEEGVSYGR